MRSKKGDVAVTFLVFMAVALAGAASLIFILSDRGIEEKIVNGRFIDNAYVQEEKLDFYINEVMSISASRTLNEVVAEKGNLDKESTEFKEAFKTKFVKIFLEELGRYKIKEGTFEDSELIQVEQQMKEGKADVRVENGKVSSSFNMVILTKEGKLSSIDSYKRTFEKNIP